MPIAIKQLSENDKAVFSKFLKTNRTELPKLKFASLVPPHEDIAVTAFKKERKNLQDFSLKYGFVKCEFAKNIVTLSKNLPITQKRPNEKLSYIFSGYVFSDKKMLIGTKEVEKTVSDIRDLNEKYGEYSLCTVDIQGNINLSSDFFGMVPWFYYEDNDVFSASNNYHLLLLLLKEVGVRLSMNVPRSRVNIITSGYTYGSPFSKDLDVLGCKINLAYEKITFSIKKGMAISYTSLWDILTDKSEWDEDLYEDYIRKCKAELEENCRAAFEHPKFNKIVVDLSGGFDSRIVFATANNLPKKLRKKLFTHTRRSVTSDDVEKASAITNMYDYPKHSYSDFDISDLFDDSVKEINLAHISRTLGTFSVSSYLYSSAYNNLNTLEITGGLGDMVFGYARIRGEVEYSLGDNRLLARLGGCYLWNSVEELQEVFSDQANIINESLNNYKYCDCLFKKFHLLYVDFRNRFNFGSAHNIENNNMRIPMLFSKYALKAKWMYFNKFTDNNVPDEKVSVDVLTAINPLMAILPFAKNNDNVLPKPENLLNPAKITIVPDHTIVSAPAAEPPVTNPYRKKVTAYIENLETAEQMLLHIYDYSDEYYSVCLGLYTVLQLLKSQPSEIKTGHARETIRKIYDIYYQIRIIEQEKQISEDI